MVQKKEMEYKPKKIALQDFQKHAKNVNVQDFQACAKNVHIVLWSHGCYEHLNNAILNVMKGPSQNWDIDEQIKNGSDPIQFVDANVATRFCFGEIDSFKVALCSIEYDFEVKKTIIKETLQYFTNAKCVVSVGYVFTFDSTCKYGDIIVSDCIDGVKGVKPDNETKYSFHPDETRFTPVLRSLNSIFDGNWEGIVCTKQRYRKAKVVTGTIMVISRRNGMLLRDICLFDNQEAYQGVVLGGVSLLEVAKECSIPVIMIHGVILYSKEIAQDIIPQKWIPTAAESVAQYLKFKFKKTSLSHPFFSGKQFYN